MPNGSCGVISFGLIGGRKGFKASVCHRISRADSETALVIETEEIDLRFVIEISLNVIANEQVEYITDIQCDGEGSYEPSKSYCIKIYFVKKGDSLWSIAKKHRIKKDALMEINNISSDSEMFDGRQIMIPIK